MWKGNSFFGIKDVNSRDVLKSSNMFSKVACPKDEHELVYAIEICIDEKPRGFIIWNVASRLWTGSRDNAQNVREPCVAMPLQTCHSHLRGSCAG